MHVCVTFFELPVGKVTVYFLEVRTFKSTNNSLWQVIWLVSPLSTIQWSVGEKPEEKAMDIIPAEIELCANRSWAVQLLYSHTPLEAVSIINPPEPFTCSFSSLILLADAALSVVFHLFLTSSEAPNFFQHLSTL